MDTDEHSLLLLSAAEYQTETRMLALPAMIALSFVAFFASAGILESFSRGMHAAATTYKFMRPGPVTTEPSPVVPAELIATPINNYSGNDGDVNISSTMMPTISGVLQRVDLCHVQNIIVPFSRPDGQPQKKELIFKSTGFPFKRTNPLVCSWNVKVSDDNCRRGIVTMKINERSRLASEKGCRKGYYRVSPFMNEAKICGRVNNVPAFQWYVEDQQPENVTITLKHNGLDDGFSEGLGFTLSGECLPDESDLTISKAIKSYRNWLDQLSRRSTGELTVVLPAVVPLEPIVSLWETQPNVTKGPTEFPNVTSETDDSTTPPPPTVQLSNTSPSSDPTDDSDDLPPIAISPFTQSSNGSNQPLWPQVDGNTDQADPVHLTIISHVVTDSPLPITTTTFQSIETTAQPLLSPSPVPDVILPVSDHDSSITSSFPMIRRRPLPTTKKPITKAPISTNMFPASSRKRPAAPVSNDKPSEIPWLILKSPGDPSSSQMYRTPWPSTTARPFIAYHQEMVRPVRRRPLVRLPSTTVRPASSSSSNPWVIVKSPQTKNIQKKKRPAPIRPKVPVVDHQGIPWLILHSPPDPPHPSESSSSAMNDYPDIQTSNQLYKLLELYRGTFGVTDGRKWQTPGGGSAAHFW